MISFHFWCKMNPMENGTRKYAIIAQWRSIKTTPHFESNIPIADGQWKYYQSTRKQKKYLLMSNALIRNWFLQLIALSLCHALHVHLQRIARPFTTNCTSTATNCTSTTHCTSTNNALHVLIPPCDLDLLTHLNNIFTNSYTEYWLLQIETE